MSPPDPSVPLAPEELAAGLEVASRLRVAVFVVAYEAESHIERTLERIPAALRARLAEIFVIDDSSGDATVEVARRLTARMPNLRVYRTPFNQGYGGNQKIGYRYAIERGFDVVVLLHGDGQYAPEVMPRLLAPFADPSVAAVFGSRMMVPGAARAGRMPFYKRVGNRVLTWIENRLLGTSLSEFHSGYRAYRVGTLATLPFQHAANGFHFDTQIIVQHRLKGLRIVEVPIPTYYGDEICRVNGIPYAVSCVTTILRARANRVGLVYHPMYDLDDRGYVTKEAPTSLHAHVLAMPIGKDERVVDLGAGDGRLTRSLKERGHTVLAVDQRPPSGLPPGEALVTDLDRPFGEAVRARLGGPADRLLALDVIEHLAEPERGLAEIHRALRPGGRLDASTGNVAYLVPRLMLLLGQFNYGKRGILDLTHKRLFTIRSFRRTLEGAGFRVGRVRGFGPPIADLVGRSAFWRLVDRVAAWLARLWPSLFAFQFLVEATRLDTVDDLMARTVVPSPPGGGA